MKFHFKIKYESYDYLIMQKANRILPNFLKGEFQKGYYLHNMYSHNTQWWIYK